MSLIVRLRNVPDGTYRHNIGEIAKYREGASFGICRSVNSSVLVIYGLVIRMLSAIWETTMLTRLVDFLVLEAVSVAFSMAVFCLKRRQA